MSGERTSSSASSSRRVLLRDASLSVADQGLAALAGLVVGVYVARTLGAAGLGTYAMTYVAVFALQGLHNSVVLQAMSVLGPRVESRSQQAYFRFLLWGGGLSIAGLSGVVLLGVAVAYGMGWLGAEGLSALTAALVYSNCWALFATLRRYRYVRQRPLGAFLQSAAYLALVGVGLFGLQEFSRPTVARVYLLLAAASLLVVTVQLRPTVAMFVPPGRRASWSYASAHWRFGKWLLVSVPFVVGTYQAYFVIVGVILSPEAAGLLKAVDSLILPFDQVAIGLTLLLTPRAAFHFDRVDTQQQRRWVTRILYGFLLLAVPYSVLVFVFGETLVERVFGIASVMTGEVVGVMVLLPVGKALIFAANVGVMALRHPAVNFVSRVVATLVTLTLGSYLTWRYGTPGAAAGLVVSVGCLALGLWYGLRRIWRSPARGYPGLAEGVEGRLTEDV